MLAENARKIISDLGFGWLLESDHKVQRLSSSDLDVIPLVGNFESGYALGHYSEQAGSETEKTLVGDLLHKFKYQYDRGAGEELADLAAEFISGQRLLKSSDFMVVVPPSFTSRPFDPLSFLAERVSRSTKIRWERDVIKRARVTKPQKGIFNRADKEENVISAFRLSDPGPVSGKRILLLDDLYDSGATLNQISQILRRARADKIFSLVLAKTRFV